MPRSACRGDRSICCSPSRRAAISKQHGHGIRCGAGRAARRSRAIAPSASICAASASRQAPSSRACPGSRSPRWPGTFLRSSRLRAPAARMASSPIVTVNLWLDRPPAAASFVGFPGRRFQWMFDKARLFGDQASHVSLVASGADDIVGFTNEALIDLARTELSEALPGRMVREPRDSRPRKARDVLAGAGPASPPGAGDTGSRVLPGGRLDRYRPPGYDRKRGPERPPGCGLRRPDRSRARLQIAPAVRPN